MGGTVTGLNLLGFFVTLLIALPCWNAWALRLSLIGRLRASMCSGPVMTARLCQVEDAFRSFGTLSDEEKLGQLSKLELRYFTPQEIANLMGFPSYFGEALTWPLPLAQGHAHSVTDCGGLEAEFMTRIDRSPFRFPRAVITETALSAPGEQPQRAHCGQAHQADGVVVGRAQPALSCYRSCCCRRPFWLLANVSATLISLSYCYCVS